MPAVEVLSGSSLLTHAVGDKNKGFEGERRTSDVLLHKKQLVKILKMRQKYFFSLMSVIFTMTSLVKSGYK